MGEEGCGISALQVANARIASGQSEISRVGSAFNSERLDLLLFNLFAHLCSRGKYAPIFAPGRKPGFAMGSMGVFLVLESKAHAQARGVQPAARITFVEAANTRRAPGDIEAALARLLQRALPVADPQTTAIISAACGAEPATSDEARALERTGLAVRALASRIGHGVEAAFPAGIAIAALAVRNRSLFAAMPGVPIEAKNVTSLTRAAVTCVGHWRSEGVGVVEAVAN
jgi:3-oxoacyl-[acyl-carrier-protein] synthase II